MKLIETVIQGFGIFQRLISLLPERGSSASLAWIAGRIAGRC